MCKHSHIMWFLKKDFNWTTLNSVQLGIPHSVSQLPQIRSPSSHVTKAWKKCRTLMNQCRTGAKATLWLSQQNGFREWTELSPLVFVKPLDNLNMLVSTLGEALYRVTCISHFFLKKYCLVWLWENHGSVYRKIKCRCCLTGEVLILLDTGSIAIEH